MRSSKNLVRFFRIYCSVFFLFNIRFQMVITPFHHSFMWITYIMERCFVTLLTVQHGNKVLALAFSCSSTRLKQEFQHFVLHFSFLVVSEVVGPILIQTKQSTLIQPNLVATRNKNRLNDCNRTKIIGTRI